MTSIYKPYVTLTKEKASFLIKEWERHIKENIPPITCQHKKNHNCKIHRYFMDVKKRLIRRGYYDVQT